MKLLVEVDGNSYTLDLRRDGVYSEYRLQGAGESSGRASVLAVVPGTYSVLLEDRSFTVNIVRLNGVVEVWVAGQRHAIAIADARDRTAKVSGPNAAGPLEIRAQMPGKVIKVLVAAGAAVEAGQGLVVVEAMKMQNEIKSSKDGVASRIFAVEGATVAAGEVLMVVS
ncbi:MAG: acetyl-CoA carboxylase biotin carboxyl carrier protein subunit [Acidobacteriota bacterium]|nr:acetyl-CoA carboxylase biotin carboxyl carrier protein subunit [Acidobacteriota bacterium]